MLKVVKPFLELLILVFETVFKLSKAPPPLSMNSIFHYWEKVRWEIVPFFFFFTLNLYIMQKNQLL